MDDDTIYVIITDPVTIAIEVLVYAPDPQIINVELEE